MNSDMKCDAAHAFSLDTNPSIEREKLKSYGS